MDKILAEISNATVFEVVNETLGEVYVGTTRGTMAELIESFRRERPKALAHWRREHRLNFRSIEFDLPQQAADAFVRNYAASIERLGCRAIVAR